MKFDHVLQIYWTKGFFYGGKSFQFNKSIDEIVDYTPGLNRRFKSLLKLRFELNYLHKNSTRIPTRQLENITSLSIEKPINVILSQINSVNNNIFEAKRLRILRLYLIRSYKGRCHAMGKPVHGQRTWSNAWSSFHNNKDLRNFLSEVKKQVKKDDRPEKVDFRTVKKKYVKKKKYNPLVKKEKIKSTWF